MKKYTALLLIGCLFVIGCKEEKKAEASQMKKVMAIHDEVMPKMGTIGNLVGELSEKEKENSTEEMTFKYLEARKDLQAAHKSMMDWMQGFGDRFDPDEILNDKELTAEKQKWLDEEEEKIKALRDQINSSIEKAKTLIETGE